VVSSLCERQPTLVSRSSGHLYGLGRQFAVNGSIQSGDLGGGSSFALAASSRAFFSWPLRNLQLTVTTSGRLKVSVGLFLIAAKRSFREDMSCFNRGLHVFT